MTRTDNEEGDTSRLSTRGDVPAEMKRALSALKAEGPSHETLERVATRLGNLLDAPPPAARPTSWLMRGLGARAVALRVGIAALTIGTGAVWLGPGAREHGVDAARAPARVEPQRDGSLQARGGASQLTPSAATPATQPGLEPARPVDEASGELSAPGAGTPDFQAEEPGVAVATAGPADRVGSPSGARRVGGPDVRRRARARVPGSSESPASSSSARVAPSQASTLRAQAALPVSALQQNGAPAQAQAFAYDAGLAPVAADKGQDVALRAPSEVELLLAARRLATHDPKAAQRLLDEHAARFPSGVLTPEREVLAIEVLRALGQTAAAEQRFEAFRGLYPNSMHLRRLSAPPAMPAP